MVACHYGHGLKNGTIVEITHDDVTIGNKLCYWAVDPNTGVGLAITDAELQDIEHKNTEEIKPLTPDEFYQKTMQLCKLETLVDKIDETDTRSLTTSGADFLDEVKRLIEDIKVQLGLPV